MPDRLEWHGDEAIAHIRGLALAGLRRAAIVVTRRAKELLSVPGTAYASGHGRRKKGQRIYGAVRSLPGEPPRKQTGQLRSRVTYEVDPSTLAARVGTNEPRGKYLELGTKRGLRPRPWLRRALAECQSRINQIFSQAGAGQ